MLKTLGKLILKLAGLAAVLFAALVAYQYISDKKGGYIEIYNNDYSDE
ncbi:MAG: hypothetical protein ACK5JF_14385 [Oscillospiraceae bacterium]